MQRALSSLQASCSTSCGASPSRKLGLPCRQVWHRTLSTLSNLRVLHASPRRDVASSRAVVTAVGSPALTKTADTVPTATAPVAGSPSPMGPIPPPPAPVPFPAFALQQPDTIRLAKQQLISEISVVRDYWELRSLMRSRASDFEGEMSAFALLQAANLRSTTDLDKLMSMDQEEAVELLDLVQEVLDSLVPAVRANLLGYPPSTQITLVSALAQLDCYDEGIFSLVAEGCCHRQDATGGMASAVSLLALQDQAAQRAVQAPEQGAAEGAAAGAAPAAAGPEGGPPEGYEEVLVPKPPAPVGTSLIGLHLVMISSAYALAGHYDPDLFDLIAKQVVQHMEYIPDVGSLVNILGAFMDVQHFDRPLLEAAGNRLAGSFSLIGPEDAAAVALVYAFFNVRNPPFYQELIDIASYLPPDETDAKSIAALYRAIQLLPEPVDLAPVIWRTMRAAHNIYGPVQLSATGPAASSLEAIAMVEEGEDVDPAILDNMRALDMVARREVSMVLDNMGLRPRRRALATEDGWFPIHVEVEYQGQRVAVQVLDAAKVCNNDRARIRGQAQSELMCMQRAGCAVAPIIVFEWFAITEAAQETPDAFEHVAAYLRTKLDRAIEAMPSGPASPPPSESYSSSSEYEPLSPRSAPPPSPRSLPDSPVASGGSPANSDDEFDYEPLSPRVDSPRGEVSPPASPEGADSPQYGPPPPPDSKNARGGWRRSM